MYPFGIEPPLASNLNFAAGQTVPNLVLVTATDGGKVAFYNRSGTVHLVADVVGWYDDVRNDDRGRFVPLDQPTRRIDTRAGGTLGPAGTLPLTMAGTAGLPAPVFMWGVAANVTATGATASTFVTVYPPDIERPVASNLNVTPGQTVANLVLSPTTADGSVAAFNWAGNVDLVVDVVGWFTSPFGALAFR